MGPFEDVRRWLESPSTSPVLIPYENYVGCILGGQFQLGPVREDSDGSVYSTQSLSAPTKHLEAKAYILTGLSDQQLRTKKRSMKRLRGRTICSIDQAEKKFIVYEVQFDSASQEEEKQSREPTSHSPEWQNRGHSRPTTSNMARCYTSPPEWSCTIETLADQPKPVMSRSVKQRKSNLPHRSIKAANRRMEPEVKASYPEVLLVKKDLKEILMVDEIATCKMGNVVGKKKKNRKRKRKRKRGLDKIKFPYFQEASELTSFLETIEMHIRDLNLKLREQEESVDKAYDTYVTFVRDHELETADEIRKIEKNLKGLETR
ncbi:MAG: hypothetical protein MMC33_008979 [Icmadophila ericetorum]|nr:hypothetical protein [Icmadophila ericetorum]